MLRVVGGLHLDRRDVAAVFVEAVVVEPGHPPGSGVFDPVDGPPGLAWFDQFGFVQAVDGFGECVIPRRQLRLIRSVISELFG